MGDKEPVDETFKEHPDGVEKAEDTLHHNGPQEEEKEVR
jgi:hypothetical protein